MLFLLARQHGKTKLDYVIASFFMNILEVSSVFGTSLSLEKAEEVWEAVVEAQEDHKDLRKSIKKVT